MKISPLQDKLFGEKTVAISKEKTMEDLKPQKPIQMEVIAAV